MIQVDIQKINEIERIFSNTPKELNLLFAKALNATASEGREESLKSVEDRYIVLRSDGVRAMRMTKASSSHLKAILRSTGRPMPLIDYDTTPRMPDIAKVTARVKSASSQKEVNKAFVARMSSGHINVFKRVGKKRFPIEGLYGPSTPQMYGNEEVVDNVDKSVEGRLNKELEKIFDRLLRG